MSLLSSYISRVRKRLLPVAFLIIIAFSMVSSGALAQEVARRDPDSVSLQFLDVGQGDAILITSSSGRRILVDTGPDTGVLRSELQSILPPLDKRIDLLIISHSDSDHSSGIRMLLQEYNIGQVLLNHESEVAEHIASAVQLASEKGISIAYASPFYDIKIDEGLFLDILTPLPLLSSEDLSANNNSIVFMLVMPHERILFTGDAEIETEKALVRSGSALTARWLKGGHHGSKTSTNSLFLDAIKPQFVVFQNSISNTYGHPAKEVIERLEERNITVYNTSIHGRIHVECPHTAPCFIKHTQRDNST